MKKVVIIIVMLLILAGGGGGAYYYFFMLNQEHEEQAEEVVTDDEQEQSSEAPVAQPQSQPQVKKNSDYYVTPERLNVRAYPEPDAFIRAVLRKGDRVTAREVKQGWVRISDYQVHDSGRDVADWIHMDYLAETAPVISAEEKRKAMAALISKSDDFVQYQDKFIIATQQLIDDGRCSFEDFELLGGWITSVTYQDDPVYFIYCGGTRRSDKIYLNAESGEIYQP